LSTWSWISRRRHREVMLLYIDHVNKVIEVIEHAKNIVEAYHRKDLASIEKEWQNVFRLEEEADNIKRRILQDLSQGIFHPIDREDVIRLVFTTDDIAAYAKAWSRRITFININEKIPENIMKAFMTMASMVYEATKLIGDAARKLIEDPRDVLAIAERIERIEESVDDVRAEALREILNICNEIKISTCLILKEIIDSIENAADKCEDVADILRSIVLLNL